MKDVEIKVVVVTKLTLRGKGEEGDPMRNITEVWDSETGDKLAEYDPLHGFPKGR